VGGIARKPGVSGESIAIREYLSLSLVFDHDVVDGAPVARFISRLRELVEGGFGLPEEVAVAVEPATA
jgi:pyruvate/2-oxoglutarate dehydrogenase complex dihydrolipoamide acyltransferase (E2) component